MLRLAPVLSLVATGVLLRMLHLASVVPTYIERLLAGGIVLGLAVLVLVQATRLLGPWWRGLPDRERVARRTGLWTLGLFGLMLLASGALRIGAAGAATGARIASSFGPLTVWPTLQLAAHHPPLTLHLPLGHAILFATTSLVMAGTIARLTRGTEADPQAAPGMRAVLGLSPLGLAPGACPACLPVLLSFGGAGLAPIANLLADPIGPIATLFDLAAPVAALAALLYVVRDHCTTLRPRPFVRRTSAVAIVVVLTTPLAAAIGGLPRGASDRQDAIYDLFILTTIGAVVLTLLVFVLLGLFAYRYRAREDAADEAQWTMGHLPRRVLMVGFFLLPIAVIFGIGAVSFSVLSGMEEIPEERVYVDVIATQFAWRFQYQNGTTQIDELHVEQGQVVVLNLSSPDVVHSLFLPDLGVKMDAMPGTITQVWFQPKNIGSYAAYCVEWCGTGHPEMRALVVVHPPGEAPGGPTGGRGG